MKLTHEFTVQYSFAICGMSPSEIHFQPLVPFPEIPDRGLSAILAREPARKRRHLLKYVAIFTLSFRFSYMFLVFFKVTKNLQKYKFPACSKPKAPGRTWLGAMWRTWQAAPVPVPAFPGLLLFCQMAEGIENQCHISTVTPQTVDSLVLVCLVLVLLVCLYLFLLWFEVHAISNGSFLLMESAEAGVLRGQLYQ